MENFIKLIQNSAVEIIVKPNSKKNLITKTNKGYVVEIKSKAENNKANEELEKFLSKITKQKVKLISGKTQKRKLVKLQ